MGLLAEARGRRVGSRLLRSAIARCRERGIEKIELQVLASNRPARALYRKFGFKQEGRRVRARKLDGKYDDVVLMGKLL
jgi:ribosomal protein S18 acetylase RimI-like enzyme